MWIRRRVLHSLILACYICCRLSLIGRSRDNIVIDVMMVIIVVIVIIVVVVIMVDMLDDSRINRNHWVMRVNVIGGGRHSFSRSGSDWNNMVNIVVRMHREQLVTGKVSLWLLIHWLGHIYCFRGWLDNFWSDFVDLNNLYGAFTNDQISLRSLLISNFVNYKLLFSIFGSFCKFCLWYWQNLLLSWISQVSDKLLMILNKIESLILKRFPKLVIFRLRHRYDK